VRVYRAGVIQLYCHCEAGDRRINEVREALIEQGIDPDDPNLGGWHRLDDKKVK